MGGFLLINPRSGRGSKAETLRAAATRLGIETHVLGPDEAASEIARQAVDGPLGIARLKAHLSNEGALYVYVAQGWLPSTWEEQSLEALTVDARAGRLEAAIDGEATELETPLRFEVEPGALRVLLPDER